MGMGTGSKKIMLRFIYLSCCSYNEISANLLTYLQVYGKLSCLGREVIEIAPSKLGYFKKALGWIKVSELSESFYFNFVNFWDIS